MLFALRKPGETEYKIPRGWLYEYVSCPNYLGEMLEWCGWAIATWSLAGFGFAIYTIANIGPRAMANHHWYRENFPDYPQRRKAVIPYLL
jgi:steroid 5-alpha-reductase/3-oxo-5-alpha-steroid 4-dehydrogenase 1